MARHIKTAALAGQQEEADAKIRSTVETALLQIQYSPKLNSPIAAAREPAVRASKGAPSRRAAAKRR